MLRVFKGDDTAFAGASTLRVTIGTALPLAGCTADFELCGVVKRIPDVSTGTFEVDYTAEETAAMPLGVHLAAVRVYDPQGRRRTSVNTLRVEVTDRVDLAYAGANAVVVDGSLVTKGVIDDGQGVPDDLPEDYTPNEMRAFLNRVAALLRNSIVTISVLAAMVGFGAAVDVAPLGTVRATSNVVTRVDLSGLAASTDVYTKAETDARIVELAPTQTEIDPTVPAWAKADTPPASGLTTNDVCGIVTNTVGVFAAGWPVQAAQIRARNFTWGGSVPPPANADEYVTTLSNKLEASGMVDFWEDTESVQHGLVGWSGSVGDIHVDGDFAAEDSEFYCANPPDPEMDVLSGGGQMRYYIGEPEDTSVLDDVPLLYVDVLWSVGHMGSANALGLARARDLPQNAAVPQLLLKGEDGNVYVVKVDSDGVLRYYRLEGN